MGLTQVNTGSHLGSELPRGSEHLHDIRLWTVGDKINFSPAAKYQYLVSIEVVLVVYKINPKFL